MKERFSDRRLKGIAGFTASAIFMAACTASADNSLNKQAQQDPKATPTPTEILPLYTSTPNATEVPVKTQEPTPQPTEKPATEVEMARKFLLDSWINDTLNTGLQKTKEDYLQGTTLLGASLLKVNATNLNNWRAQKDIILGGLQAEETLKVSWAGGSYMHQSTSDNAQGQKYFGQIEIKDVVIGHEDISPISEEDKANGITWKGNYSVNYAERFRSKTFWQANGELSLFKKWITTFDNKDLPDFTDWYITSYDTEIVLQNGKWKIKPQDSSTIHSSAEAIKGFVIPYDQKEELGTVCGNSCPVDFQPQKIS